jgi:hypothetical protein
LIVDDWAGESLWGTASVASHAEAKALAKRLAAIAAEMSIAPGGREIAAVEPRARPRRSAPTGWGREEAAPEEDTP